MSPEVPLDRIRVQIVRGKRTEMWGIIRLNELPFCFRAWPLASNNDTGWGFVHAPYEPLSFTPPIFTTGITEDDMTYMLSRLRVKNEKIKGVRQDGTIPQLFRATLGRRQRAYQNFQELYNDNAKLRREYGIAVSNACDHREIQLHNQP